MTRVLLRPHLRERRHAHAKEQKLKQCVTSCVVVPTSSPNCSSRQSGNREPNTMDRILLVVTNKNLVNF